MSKKNENKVREPLFHIAKRNSMVWWKAWLIRGTAILASLVVCALIIVLLTKQNPLEVYASMFKGPIN